MSAGEVAGYSRAYAAGPVRRWSKGADVVRSCSAGRVRGRHRRGLLDGQRGRARHRLVRCAARTAGRGRARPRRSSSSPRPPTATRGRCPTAACWWSAPPRPACSWPTSSPVPGGRWCWRWARTPGCPAATAAWTSCGGSTRWACSTGGSRRTRAPAAQRSRPCNSSAAPDGRDVDLRSLQDRGVRLAGRLAGVDGRRVRFADDLAETTDRADDRLRRPAAAASTRTPPRAGLRRRGRPPRAGPRRPGRRPRPRLDLRDAGIRTVLWATGYRRAYPWLHVPVLDADGRDPAHRRRHAGTRTVRAGDALAVAAQLRVPGRGPPRRGDRGRPGTGPHRRRRGAPERAA